MRNLEIYKAVRINRKLFSDNWGVGMYVHGYPYHTQQCYVKSHKKSGETCQTWTVLAVASK
jgi:hypothetical protein